MVDAADAVRDFLTAQGYPAEVDYVVEVHTKLQPSATKLLVTPISEETELAARGGFQRLVSVSVVLLQPLTEQTRDQEVRFGLEQLQAIRTQLVFGPDLPDGWQATGQSELTYDPERVEKRNMLLAGLLVELVKCG